MGRRRHNAKCDYCKKDHGDGSPWWNKAKGGWSISLGKGRNRLLAKGWEGHDEAIRLWRQAPSPTTAFPVNSEGLAVENICDDYLGHLATKGERNLQVRGRGTRTFKRLLPIFQDFADELGKMPAAEITVSDAEKWLVSHAWGDGTMEAVCKALKAAFNLAVRKGQLKASPLANLNTGFERRRAKPRTEWLEPEQEQALLAASFDALALAIRVLIATGVRPDEFCSVTAADVREFPGTGRLAWSVAHKTQLKTNKRRDVFLNNEMGEITRQQIAKYPSGPLFRNRYGGAWTPLALSHSFMRARRKPACVALGLDKHTVSPSGIKIAAYVPYTCRHTFAFRLLTGFYKDPNGEPIERNYDQVAALLGNSAAEVERTYGHLPRAVMFLSNLMDYS